MPYLLDTNTCIQLMRHIPAVVEQLAQHSPADCWISTITTYELYTGVSKCADPAGEGAKVALLTQTIRELPFDRGAAIEAGRLRAELEARGEMIGPYDVLLAAQALAAGLTLVSSNLREFQRVGGIQAENWNQ